MTTPQTPVGGPEQNGPSQVAAFHRNSDVDSSPLAQHHTLGIRPNQSSPGDHTHNGRDSRELDVYSKSETYSKTEADNKFFDRTTPMTITGSRGGNVALASLLSALSSEGIIIDNTTA